MNADVIERTIGLAEAWFHDTLKRVWSAEPGNFLRSRGVDVLSVGSFRVGWAPYEWDRLLDRLDKYGLGWKELVAAGLAKEPGSPRFRGRVVFPIKDELNYPISFSGRVIADREGTPKYLNGPETNVFKKREVLFGLWHAKQAWKRRSRPKAVVTEGALDVILSHQAKAANVVGTLGTAFGIHHAHILARYVQRLCFAFDGDEAGVKATYRALMETARAGTGLFRELTVARMPEGEDPADLAISNPKKLRKLYREGRPFYRWLRVLGTERFSDACEVAASMVEPMSLVEPIALTWGVSNKYAEKQINYHMSVGMRGAVEVKARELN